MSQKKFEYKDIGGQAVMEGVMMQSPQDESMAIAVRKPDGRIVVTCEHREPISKKHAWMGKPFIRGCVNMVLMLKMGMQTLDKGTQMLGITDEEPTKFEKWLSEKLG
ncbi:MAG: protein-(glutamine-N5) methyltransferase, release factor-specific, partial [Clostridia bacterium]|nr:protein-(glutamine-N5) methyltransferase, release factor-specific [Clostridia bacterium]